MKIQIDTDNKIIRLLEISNLADFVKFAKRLLGDDYEKYSIDMSGSGNLYPWTYPIIIPYPYPVAPTIPYSPYGWPIITCDTGTYNLEVQCTAEPIKN